MEHEESRSSPQAQYHSHIEEAHASFFQGHPQLNLDHKQDEAEPQSPPQRARPDVAAEDLELGGQNDEQMHRLQLAAQMSQALQNVGRSPSAAEQDPYDQEDPNLDSLRELQDEEPDTDMHSQEPVAHGLPELPDNTQPNLVHDLQRSLQHSLQQIVPRPASPHNPQPQHTPLLPQPQHTYMESPRQPVLAPAGPSGGVQTQYTLGDMTPPRKRSKVSRACDECRRKKVKCDASSETGDEICSNCRRSSVKCLFSRVPQKRGPSKGYIKELADRINSIEGKLGGQSVAEALAGELTSRRNTGQEYAAPVQEEDTRKRGFSQMANNAYQPPASSRQPGWATETRAAFPRPTYSANGLALKPILPRENITLVPIRMPSAEGVLADLQASPTLPSATGVGDHVFHAYVAVALVGCYTLIDADFCLQLFECCSSRLAISSQLERHPRWSTCRVQSQSSICFRRGPELRNWFFPRRHERSRQSDPRLPATHRLRPGGRKSWAALASRTPTMPDPHDHQHRELRTRLVAWTTRRTLQSGTPRSGCWFRILHGHS